jgi:hypothetical protein
MSQPIAGSFVGVPAATLQLWLTDAQTARHQLTTGARPQVIAYGQGDGTKAVTYTRANIADLDNYIASLMRALGLGGKRRAVGVAFA